MLVYFVYFYWESFSYTSRAGFIFIGGVSLTHPVLASFLSWEFPLHIPCWLRFLFIFYLFLSGEFLLHIPCWIYIPCFFFFFFFLFFFFFSFICGVSLTHPVLVSFFIGGVSLTHPMLGSFLSGVFLLHIPCWLLFCLGSFSYTPRALRSLSYTSIADFIFMLVVYPTHPVLPSFLSGEILLHIPCWIFLSV